MEMLDTTFHNIFMTETPAFSFLMICLLLSYPCNSTTVCSKNNLLFTLISYILSFHFYLISKLYWKMVTNWISLSIILTQYLSASSSHLLQIQTYSPQHIWQRQGKQTKLLYLLVVWETG